MADMGRVGSGAAWRLALAGAALILTAWAGGAIAAAPSPAAAPAPSSASDPGHPALMGVAVAPTPVGAEVRGDLHLGHGPDAPRAEGVGGLRLTSAPGRDTAAEERRWARLALGLTAPPVLDTPRSRRAPGHLRAGPRREDPESA